MKDILKKIGQALSAVYDGQELESVSRALCLELLDIDKADFYTKAKLSADSNRDSRLDAALKRLEKGEPLQYVLGNAPFCGLNFKVGPGVLVPRPETGELVSWVISETSGPAGILDIGTGSGCIAVTLASKMPQCTVKGWDISDEALSYARSNSELNGTDVVFEKHDVLASDLPEARFDVIVSNPPYIIEKEKSDMARTVLDYEPALALFVPDNDPLLFYRAIAMFGKRALKPGGSLYFEINPMFAGQLQLLLERSGYHNVTLRRDIFGKLRMIKATANE